MRINRRQAVAGGLGVALGAGAAGAQAARRPNMVFIMADDLGWGDLGCYGNTDFGTPVLDGLARDGVRLTQAYANSCVCSQTRMALMTGRYQYRWVGGLEEPIKEGVSAANGLPPAEPTLPSMLRKAGYRTALVGKWHLGFLPHFGPLKSGYDEFYGVAGGGADYFTHRSRAGRADLFSGEALIDEQGYLTDLLTARAVDFVGRAAATPERPFLLSLHYTAPHWPWEAEGDAARSAAIKDLFDYGGGSLKTYAAMVGSLDRGIGRVLAALDKAGLEEDTIVVFTSDNGGERFSRNWPLVGQKGDLLEGGIRVPGIVRYPRAIRRGQVSAQVATSMDWTATLLAAGGAKAEAALEGMDLMPVLRGAPAVPRRLFWRFVGKRQAAVRDGAWKYLRVGAQEYLFDVEADARERANLATAEPERLRALREAHAAWSATMLPDAGVQGYEVGADKLAV